MWCWQSKSSTFKTLRLCFCYSIHYNIQGINRDSQLPVQFRSANVTPLHKISEKILPGNYRQISLTVIACKIMGGIVRTEIDNFLFKFNLLPVIWRYSS